MFTFCNLDPSKLLSFANSTLWLDNISAMRVVEWFKDFTNMELEFMLHALPLKINIKKAPENLEMELIIW